jgi:hypothetical protein
MNRTITLQLLLGICCMQSLFSQNSFTHHFSLHWSPTQSLIFDGSVPAATNAALPAYSYRMRLAGQSAIQVTLDVIDEDKTYIHDASLTNALASNYSLHSTVEQVRGTWYASIWFVPVRKESNGDVYKLFSGQLEITTVDPQSGIPRSGPQFKTNSVLASGTVFQLGVTERGIYKLDYNFIKDKLGIEPSAISPSRIGIFGNGSGIVPQWNKAPRIDDLEQTPTYAVGMEDGQINPGDFFLWYGESPNALIYDSVAHVYREMRNIYDDTNHYYVVLNGPDRVAMNSRPSASGHDYVSSQSLFHQRFEEEKVNLLGRFRPPGSGQEWYGDELAVLKELDYTSRFDYTDMVTSDTLHYSTHFAVRADLITRFQIDINSHSQGRNMGSVTFGDFEGPYATDALIQSKFIPNQPITKIKVSYPSANGVNARAWIDYIELNTWRSNNYKNGQPFYLSDPRSRYLGQPGYQVANLPANALIWDITNPVAPILQQYGPGQTPLFSAISSGSLQPEVFVCFSPTTDVKEPVFEGAIEHQDFHALQRADLVIIYHDAFEPAAAALKEHRETHDQLVVEIVPVSKLIHEFGGGSKDPSAIRDFARMMFNRDPDFRYLLLIGDATYDYLNLSPDVPYQNFMPAFETAESLDPIRSFPTDDYFALLSEEEGDNLIGAIDIAVGRFPVSTPEEAMEIVDKIIHYDTSPSTLRDWRNRVVMVADDEDFNVHLDQADRLAVKKSVKHPDLNQQKIYLDAYPQQSTPGGDRYPDANSAIDLNMEKGALTVTYLGHGGPNGWTQERVLGINQAQSYGNIDNMPLYITATCSFAGYDEPGFKSTGEHLLINPSGGAIGLMTTVRPVFSGSNERLTDEVLKILYTPDSNGDFLAIGEVLRRAKNNNANDTTDNNARKFTLLGDPSLKLAIPDYQVVVNSIQGQQIDSSFADTLSALEGTIITGEIRNRLGQKVSDFNGTIYVTLFDKAQVRKTLANDEKSAVRNFTTQTRQLFKGTASVINGEWSIEFVLPKDIDFSYGFGKLSFYAENQVNDASGYFKDITVGGVHDGGIVDDVPPVVELFLNTNSFRSGGITDNSPAIYAEISDDYGINVSGTSIGHDLEAILDGDDRNSIILNDFYQATENDHRKGIVRFPLNDLSPGRHTLSLTAWDLSNNPGYDEIEFIVVEDEATLLTRLVSYPNPFNDETQFAFEHNRPEAAVSFEVQIYNTNGQLVRTLSQVDPISGGYRVDNVAWKGDGQNGSQLPSGIYYYRVRASFLQNEQTEIIDSEANKVVIIR